MTIGTGAVTRANMRLSVIDGIAFADFSAANVLTLNAGKCLTIRDHAGKVIYGWIKAAGTGENTTAYLTGANSTFASDTGFWSKSALTVTISGGKCNFATTNQNDGLDRAALVAVGTLFKSTIEVSGFSAGGVQWLCGAYLTERSTNNTFVEYVTATSVNIHIIAAEDATTLSVDNVLFDSVDTPANTGVTIVTLPSGTVYNWAYKQTGFNYNDSLGYTYIVSDQVVPSYIFMNPQMLM
jgi:hypothetical protein